MADTGKRSGHKAPEGYDASRYEKPSVACDVVIVCFRDERLQVLLIERGYDPCRGCLALPGGFVEMDESLEAAAAREVCEETGIKDISVIQLGAYGDPGRDPRTRVVSVAFLALVQADRTPRAGDDARAIGWHCLTSPPELAFDHAKILADARERLRELAVMTPRLFELLQAEFTAGQYLGLCREVMGRAYDQEVFFECMSRIPCFAEVEDGSGPKQSYRFEKSGYQVGDFTFLLFGK